MTKSKIQERIDAAKDGLTLIRNKIEAVRHEHDVVSTVLDLGHR